MKKVLMIAYFYPPLGGVGCIRPLQFSKYLPEFGWQATVLSVYNDLFYPQDKSLMSLIPPYQQVIRSYRIPLFDTLRKLSRGPLKEKQMWYSFVDPQYDWVPNAINAGGKLIKRDNFDAMIATAPPYSSLRVARVLKAKYNIPTIADLRDPYTTNEMMSWATKWHQKFYSIYERKLLNHFDYLVTTNESHQVDLSKILGISRKKIALITNGYDPEEFKFEMKEPPKDRFVIGYVGSIYGKVSPRSFFKALQVAIKKRPDIQDSLEVVFYGKMLDTYIKSEAKKANVEEFINIQGTIPHEEAIEVLHECHLLVQFGGMVSRSIPAKIFEYAASGRPVLNFDHPDIANDFITRNKLGISVNGLNPEEGAVIILEMFDSFLKGLAIPGASKKDSERFSRRQLTGNLAEILDSIITT